MTRIHDGSPPTLLHSKSADASNATNEVSCSLPGDSARRPAPGVLVTYDEFNERRQLRRRVTAAFERLQRERTIDVDVHDVTHVQEPSIPDE
jgi:hypothetical protein